jgi:hypothetical protein
MIIVDLTSDFLINKRYRKPLTRFVKKSILKTIIQNNESEDYSIKVFTNSKNLINISYWFDNGCYKHEVYRTVISPFCCNKEALEKIKLLNLFINQNSDFSTTYNPLTGVYSLFIPIVHRELVLMKTECIVCLEANKQKPALGFFNCNHTDLCAECYQNLNRALCPLCRAK